MSKSFDDQVREFGKLVQQYKYDFCTLVYLVFPFGEVGHELEFKKPYKWQMEEWAKMSKWLANPITRFKPYKLNISSGNGAAKTSFMHMTLLMMMYAHQVKARITANTQPQMKSITWPELDVWFRHARYSDHLFEKLGESVKSRDSKLAEQWRVDAVTWNENNPVAMSGLHNAGKAVFLGFDEAAGIPHVIWKYADGAMSDIDTIKIWVAVGNSDDPESCFEQNMASPDWNVRRIDTRTMDHVDQEWIGTLLRQCGGNEDHDDFRVRVRGLPRKSAKDSIMSMEAVSAALERRHGFNKSSVRSLPCILMCDPAWQGGDETVIWYRQGHYFCLLERYKLSKARGEDHKFTYIKLLEWERKLRADVVFIDQGEGTALKTFANADGKYNWELVSFAASANDAPNFEQSEYANLRAQMYFEANKALLEGAILDSIDPEWIDDIQKQLCWTKGDRHKTNLKKIAEAKDKIKLRVGRSPDIADGFVLGFARTVFNRLPENEIGERAAWGSEAFKMPEYDPYESTTIDHTDIYDRAS